MRTLYTLCRRIFGDQLFINKSILIIYVGLRLLYNEPAVSILRQTL